MRKIILDIENELQSIEDIFYKYITLPDNVIYVKNNRYPHEDRRNLEMYSKLNLISSTPWHPMLCVPTILEILTLYIYNETSEFEHFKSNILIPNNSKCFIKTRSVEPIDLLIDYFKSYVSSIATIDINTILSIIDNIYYTHIHRYILDYPNIIYTFDDSTGNIILIDSGDIRAYRYTEYLNYKQGNS